MLLVTLNYEYTEYVRRPTCGGQDSEFSHTKKSYAAFSMVVPDDGWRQLTEYWETYVRNYHQRRFHSDPVYKVTSVSTIFVDAVYQPAITMMQ